MEADYIPEETFTLLLAQMKPINALALRISLATGLRIGDVLAIKWRDLQANSLTAVSAKTGKQGTYTLPLDVFDEIMRLCPYGGKAAYIFPGRGKTGHRTRQTVFLDMKNAAKRLRIIEHASPHSARKTFAVGLRKSGATEGQIQRALQHSDRVTTKIYSRADRLNLTPERLDEIIDLICDRVAERLKDAEQ